MNNKSFSLIEILIVVSIIAIIAAVALPAYTQHRNRVIVANVVNNVRTMVINPILVNYAKAGTLPSSIVVNGTTLAPSNGPIANGWNPISGIANVYAMAYVRSTDMKGFRIGVTINNLTGLTGYTPTSMPNGNSGSDTLYFGFRNINGTFDGVCGRNAGFFSQAIPLSLIPSACNCNDVSSFAYSDTPSC